MKLQSVLVIDDNAVTRKMVRVALATEGFAVLEAGDGREALDAVRRQIPDLIIQDIVLPDVSGFNLVQQLRAVPGVGEIPIIACTGFTTRFDDLQAASGDFTDFMAKPVEPSHLVKVVRTYLPKSESGFVRTGGGRRILVADDDPVQRKLLVIRLRQNGFAVTDVSDGAEALECARAAPPDAIVSDVLMPRLDGFQLCLAIRQDPQLAHLPVVLATSSYLEPEDQTLAARVGASAFVVRSPDLESVMDALRANLNGGSQPSVQAVGVGDEAYAYRIIRQLERQSSMNRALAQRCTLQAAELAVLSGISDALARHADTDRALTDVLHQCLDSGGLSKGILYLRQGDSGIVLHTAAGYGTTQRERVESFFGHRTVLEAMIEAEETVILPSRTIPASVNDHVLSNANAKSAIIVPLVARGERLGALVLAADDAHLAEGEWFAFAQTVGAQIAQAIALTRTMSRLAVSEQRYRGLMENANDAIFVLDRERHVLEANRRAETMLSRSRDQLVGRNFMELCGVSSPEAARRLGELFTESGRLDAISLLCSDATPVVAELSSSVVHIDGTYATMLIARDISERIAAAEALRRSEEQLRQSQKMEAIGRLAGGIAHDFNNMLTAMSGYSHLLREDLDPVDPKRENIAEIERAVDRAAALTQQLLAFSRQQMLQPRVLDLNMTVTEIGKMLRRLVPENVTLVKRLDRTLGSVRADPGQIEQVLMNLVVNARDAMPDGGVVTIETANVQLDEVDLRRHTQTQIPAGRYVRLAVSDTGIGMDEATQAKIFEPFFTTKAKGQGTGLGLAMVYGIVKQSEGFIWCYSEPGRGTTFKVYLPQVDAPADGPAVRGSRSGAQRGSETILLVEDDQAVRSVTRRILAKLGYTVLEADNGTEALRLVAETQAPISLIVSDMVMPEISGPELARRLRANDKHVRMLFMSGYTEEASRRQSFLDVGDEFIEKPFSPGALAEKIRDVLEAPAPA